MAREKDKAEPVDAAASYGDPRAVPLRDAVKLLDLAYPELDDDQLRDQIVAPRLRNGRFRIIGYEKQRRLSDEPVLVPTELVSRAFQDLRAGMVYDPLHDRVVRRSIVVGTASARMLRERPELREQLREHQRLAALPPAVDWPRCAIRAGRFAFVDCRVIRAEDLSEEKPEPKVAPAGQRRGPPRRRAPHDAVERLKIMIEALPGATGLKAWELAEEIVAVHPEVQHSDSDGNVVNADGWWSSATLQRYVSDYRR